MNLIDLLGGQELEQNSFSTSGFTFGGKHQLKVVGFAGKVAKSIMYIVRCEICSKDPEMFGEGYFRITRSNINSGRIPCGCSKTTKYTESQFATICGRILAEHNCEFVGFHGNFNGQKSKIEARCREHGVWTSTWVNSLMASKTGCPVCRGGIKKPDSVMIEGFMKSGSFHKDTKFSRIDKKNKRGFKAYWQVDCPVCGETGISTNTNLIEGKKCCACKGYRQDKAYVMEIREDNRLIALKFGVSHNPVKRVWTLNSKSHYRFSLYTVYQFEDLLSSKRFEELCRLKLDVNIIDSANMRDGWTETTSVDNLPKLLEILKGLGGKMILSPESS